MCGSAQPFVHRGENGLPPPMVALVSLNSPQGPGVRIRTIQPVQQSVPIHAVVPEDRLGFVDDRLLGARPGNDPLLVFTVPKSDQDDAEGGAPEKQLQRVHKMIAKGISFSPCLCNSFAMALLAILVGCASAPTPQRSEAPPHRYKEPVAAADQRAPNQAGSVILLIGDGMGAAYWTAAKFAADSLAVQRMPVVGLVDTRSTDSRVTDSAAGATVYASGVRTYNGAIGVGPECLEMMRRDSLAVTRDPASCAPLRTVFDVARERGMATGLVATSSITHATPASFAAHVPRRSMQPEIARQLAAGPVDVLLGGGRGFFTGSLRPDSQDVLAAACRTAVCLSEPAELATYRPDGRRLIGLFADEHLERAAVREPSLVAMTDAALARLSQNGEGFFLVVEGSQPDWRGHENAPLRAVVEEVLDFDHAIGRALDYAAENPRTLVVVTADHETGGLAVSEQGDTLAAAYTTDYHTAQMVPLFAAGPGAERFGGIKENWQIGNLLLEAIREE